jgi:hypothetical protein
MPKHFSFSILTSLACVTVLGASGCDDAAVTPTTPDMETTVPGPECPAPACPPDAAPQGYLCETANHGTSMKLGKYTLMNNLWGLRSGTATGQQCFWGLCDTGSAIGWGTSWDWTGGSSSQILSYTAAMLGSHFSVPSADSGMPVPLSSTGSVTCTWSYSLTRQKGVAHNVAYDIWVGYAASPTSPTDEIMIWLTGSGVGPNGNPAGTVELAGALWAVFEGSTAGWKIHSFVRGESVNCATLNILDFTNYLIKKQVLASDKDLLGIEAGPETLNGQGELATQYYSCNVQ